MKEKIVLSLLLCCLGSALLAQAPETLWTRTYGTDEIEEAGYWVGETSDSGYLVLATTPALGAGFYDVWLIKTDLAGDTIWTRTYGGSQNDMCKGMEPTSDGGYIMAGYTSSYGAGGADLWLVKLEADGDTLWTKTYGGTGWEGASAVRQTSDGGYIVGGFTNSFGHGADDFWLLKTDPQGDTVWTRTYGGPSGDDGRSVRQMSDGGYIMTGYTISDGFFDYDLFLVRTDSIGDTLWTRTYGDSGWQEGYDALETADSGFVVIGLTESSQTDLDAWMLRIDSSGDTLWTRSIGGTFGDGPTSFIETADGHYLIVGWTYSCGGNREAYLIKTDAFGDTLWTGHYGGAEDEEAHFIAQTSDGGYVIVGETDSFGAGFEDVWIVKLQPETGLLETPFVRELRPSVRSSPNPFRQEVRIELATVAFGDVDLAIYDVTGRKVRNLSMPGAVSGPQIVRWDGRDEQGQQVPAGVYFCRLTAGGLRATEKVILLR
jgi:hypothetical protein